MSRRIVILMGLTAVLVGNVGCCAWADRWCHRNQPAPQACYPAPAPACYPAPQQCAPAYAPPPAAPYCPPPGYNGPYR